MLFLSLMTINNLVHTKVANINQTIFQKKNNNSTAAIGWLPDKMKDKFGPMFRQGLPGLEEFSCFSSGWMGQGVPSWNTCEAIIAGGLS